MRDFSNISAALKPKTFVQSTKRAPDLYQIQVLFSLKLLVGLNEQWILSIVCLFVCLFVHLFVCQFVRSFVRLF